ncbi:MAG TPA: phosphatidylglycerol lysyltransferase domain-containing protein [Streptosporangiaceae bacterium]
MARGLALVAAIVGVTAAAIGWMYWLRTLVAHWPGPVVADALPLDELPGHGSFPFILCIPVFAVASVGLGLVVRRLGLSRLAGGLSLGLGVGAWLFLVDAISLVIVRQEPLGDAVRVASRLQLIYLAAAMAGAAGALLGQSAARRRRIDAAPVLTWLVALGGVADLAAALLRRPGPAVGLVERFGAAGVVHPAAHVLLVPVGALLLIGARGLARRSRRAWQLSVALLGMSAVLHLIRGPHYAAAIITCLIAIALVARRQDFPFSGDPDTQPSAVVRLGGMLALAVGYAILSIFVYRTIAGLPFSWPGALEDTVRGLIGIHPVGDRQLPGEFSRWFPFSVLSLTAIGLIWAAGVWLRPWRQRIFPDAERRRRATQIVRRWGTDTLAPFTLRADKDWFITGRTLIAYRVVRGVAVVTGDPVGPVAEAGQALDEFLAHTRARGWHVTVLGASDRLLGVYRDRGLRPTYHGGEAVIDVASFSLDGRRMRAVRQAVHRVDRGGYRAEARFAGHLSPALRADLAATDEAWLCGEPRKGFTMELDSLFRLGGTDAVFLVGRDADGRPAGCLHLAVCGPSRSLSLSSMPRRPGTPNGFNAWLIVNAVAWAGRNGFEHVSLNFSPFADLLSPGAPLSAAQRLERGALLRLKGVLALQLDNLMRFNSQFDPRWQPRYVVVEHRTDLPRVAVTAMAAEGYLPHADLIRGRDRAAEKAETPLADQAAGPSQSGR